MKFLKIFFYTFLAILSLLFIFYLYVANKSATMQREMMEYTPSESSLEVKEKRLEMTSKEKLFCDSIKNLGFSNFKILHDIEYVEKDSIIEITDREFIVYYDRRTKEKSISLDSIIRFRKELVKKMFSGYISDSTFNEHDHFSFEYDDRPEDYVSYSKKDILQLTNTKLVKGKDNNFTRVKIE